MPVLIGLNRGFLLVGRDLRGNSYDFPRDFSRVERRTRIVIAGLMMVVEITTGLRFHSMALLVDGWHMSTHVTAFLITAIAYRFMAIPMGRTFQFWNRKDSGKFAAIVSIVAHEPKTCDAYRELLRGHSELVHVTIETQHCRADHGSVARFDGEGT